MWLKGFGLGGMNLYAESLFRWKANRPDKAAIGIASGSKIQSDWIAMAIIRFNPTRQLSCSKKR